MCAPATTVAGHWGKRPTTWTVSEDIRLTLVFLIHLLGWRARLMSHVARAWLACTADVDIENTHANKHLCMCVCGLVWSRPENTLTQLESLQERQGGGMCVHMCMCMCMCM